jgi:2-polyprenyl-6-methoxyphenol hydroxylase-like FAD-dependent oxidoreductase
MKKRSGRVLIVGAGIGGLTAAIALRRCGAEVTVIERAQALAPVGAGITLQPNATAVLGALGVALDPADVLPIGEFAVLDAHGRRLFGGAPVDEDAAVRGYTMRRADLHKTLAAACGAVPVRLGVELVGLEQGEEGVRVRLGDGREERWDVVVGADGLRSAVRRAIAPASACAPRYSGQTCWRLQVEAPALAPSASTERWAVGRRIGVVPLSRGGIYVYLVESSPPGTVGPESARVEGLRRFAAGDPLLGAILDHVAGDPRVRIHHGDLLDLPIYASGVGRVALIGDAGHAMTPNMGQGAGMAIEDAGALALLWLEHGASAALVTGMQALRRARVMGIHRKSWSTGQVAHWRLGAARWLRDWLLRRIPAKSLERSARATWAPGRELARELAVAFGSAGEAG